MRWRSRRSRRAVPPRAIQRDGDPVTSASLTGGMAALTPLEAGSLRPALCTPVTRGREPPRRRPGSASATR